MKFAARRVAAESKRGEPRRTSAKFFVKRVFRETFVQAFQRVQQANFFSRAAHAERERRRSVAGQRRGEKENDSQKALALTMGRVGGYLISFRSCGDMIFIFREVIKKQYFIAFIEILDPLFFILDVGNF